MQQQGSDLKWYWTCVLWIVMWSNSLASGEAGMSALGGIPLLSSRTAIGHLSGSRLETMVLHPRGEQWLFRIVHGERRWGYWWCPISNSELEKFSGKFKKTDSLETVLAASDKVDYDCCWKVLKEICQMDLRMCHLCAVALTKQGELWHHYAQASDWFRGFPCVEGWRPSDLRCRP